jgi:hypothetical protein
MAGTKPDHDKNIFKRLEKGLKMLDTFRSDSRIVGQRRSASPQPPPDNQTIFTTFIAVSFKTRISMFVCERTSHLLDLLNARQTQSIFDTSVAMGKTLLAAYPRANLIRYGHGLICSMIRGIQTHQLVDPRERKSQK